MKVSEFVGKKVLDKNAVEIGKVSDVDLMPKEGVIGSIMVSTGDLLRNKTFEIKSGDIAQIGDYMLLNLEGTKIAEMIQEEKEEKPKKTRLTLNK